MITFKQFLELVESSSPERGRRRLTSRGPKDWKWDRLDDRRKTSDRVALKKAGFKRNVSGEDPKDTAHDSSPYHYTTVRTYKNQSDSALDGVQDKNLATGDLRGRGRKVTPTATIVRDLKAVRKQMGGDRTSKPVHDVSIHADDEDISKNDQENLIPRGRSFSKELRSVPQALKNVGAKPGDKVTAEPAAVMRGEDPKKGRRKRDRIYAKQFGSKMNPKTGMTIGTMKG
jgi:hypothetical protein